MDMNVDGHMGSNIGRTKDKDIEGTGERKIALGFHACVGVGSFCDGTSNQEARYTCW